VRRIAKYNAIFQFLIFVDTRPRYRNNPTSCGDARKFFVPREQFYFFATAEMKTRDREKKLNHADEGNVVDVELCRTFYGTMSEQRPVIGHFVDE